MWIRSRLVRSWPYGLSVALVATVAFGGLLALYSVLVPLYEAPDEPAHVDLVMHAATGGDAPAYDGRRWSAAVVADCGVFAATRARCPAGGPATGLRTFPRYLAPSRSGGATFNELGGDAQVGDRNQLAQHPPLYYAGMGLLVRMERRLTGGTWSMASEVAWLRLANGLLVLPLPLLAWWTARRIGARPTECAVASVLPLLIPQLTHIGSTVNNDNLLLVLCAAVLALCAGVVRGDRRIATAVAIGLASGVALLTKSSALVLVPLVGLSYAVTAWRTFRGQRVGLPRDDGSSDVDRSDEADRRRTRLAAVGSIVVCVLVALGVAAALGAWWYVRNVLRHGHLVPSIDDERINASLQRPGFKPSAREWSSIYFHYMVPRFWGWFGWYSVQARLRLAQASSVLLGAVGLVAVMVRHGRQVPGDNRPGISLRRRHLVALLVPALALLAGVIDRAWSLYVISSQAPFLQGRYLFPAVTTTAVVVAVGLRKVAGRWALALAVGWVAVMQIDALAVILPGYWGGPGLGPRGQTMAMLAWSRWSPFLVVIVMLVTVAAGVGLVAQATRQARVTSAGL